MLRPGGELGRVWSLSRALTYRSLDQLADRGLVRAVGEEPGIAGGNRTVLAATRTGRAELRRWLAAPGRALRDLRSELLLKLVIADRCGIDVTPMLQRQRAIVAELAAATRHGLGATTARRRRAVASRDLRCRPPIPRPDAAHAVLRPPSRCIPDGTVIGNATQTLGWTCRVARCGGRLAGMLPVKFELTRRFDVPVRELWDELIDWPAHGAWIPATTIEGESRRPQRGRLHVHRVDRVPASGARGPDAGHPVRLGRRRADGCVRRREARSGARRCRRIHRAGRRIGLDDRMARRRHRAVPARLPVLRSAAFGGRMGSRSRCAALPRCSPAADLCATRGGDLGPWAMRPDCAECRSRASTRIGA